MATKKKQIDWRVLTAVVLGLTIIECVALCNGINGTMFSIIAALLGGIAGLSLPQLKTK